MPQSVLTRIWDTIAGGQPVDRWFGEGDKNVDVLRRILPDELWQRDVDDNGVRSEWKARPLIFWINARCSNLISHFRWKPDGASQITISAFG